MVSHLWLKYNKKTRLWTSVVPSYVKISEVQSFRECQTAGCRGNFKQNRNSFKLWQGTLSFADGILTKHGQYQTSFHPFKKLVDFQHFNLYQHVSSQPACTAHFCVQAPCDWQEEDQTKPVFYWTLGCLSRLRFSTFLIIICNFLHTFIFPPNQVNPSPPGSPQESGDILVTTTGGSNLETIKLLIHWTLTILTSVSCTKYQVQWFMLVFCAFSTFVVLRLSFFCKIQILCLLYFCNKVKVSAG